MNYQQLAGELLQNLHVLRRVKCHRQIAESMRGEIFVLQYIFNHGPVVTPSEIGNEMVISSARIAATLNSLEKKGWITRKIDKNDRRRILVELTKKGQETTEDHRRRVVNIVVKILQLLGEDDAREYARITKKMSDLVADDKNFFFEL